MYLNENQSKKVTQDGEEYFIEKGDTGKLRLQVPENEKDYVIIDKEPRGAKKWIAFYFEGNKDKPKDTFGYFKTKTDLIEFSIHQLKKGI